jgi:hypothetical protein
MCVSEGWSNTQRNGRAAAVDAVATGSNLPFYSVSSARKLAPCYEPRNTRLIIPFRLVKALDSRFGGCICYLDEPAKVVCTTWVAIHRDRPNSAVIKGVGYTRVRISFAIYCLVF